MRKPNFFIVGAPKAGTTSLYSYLRQHPQIFMSAIKEPLFFGSDLDVRIHRVTLDQYLQYFSSAGQESRLGEATVWYLSSSSAPAEISEFSPDARIIVMLRKPVDLITSLHRQLVLMGFEDRENLGEALDAEPARRRGEKIPDGARIVDTLFYRNIGRLGDQLNRYLGVFGPDRVFPIVFDDFKNDTRSVYRDTLRFLEVDDSFEPDFTVRNKRKRARSRWLRDFLYNPPDTLKPIVRALLSDETKHRIIKQIVRWNSAPASAEPAPLPIRQALVSEFAPQVDRLESLLKRRLPDWNKP